MRVSVVPIALSLAFVATTGAQAQTPATAPREAPIPTLTGVQVLSAARIGAISDSIPAGPVNSRQIARFDGLANSISRRDTSGVPERHERFGDIFVVQRGHARLRYGGTVEGDRTSGGGEWKGGTIQGGTESPLGPGDMVVIPAGIPHQLLLAPGDRGFVYFVFKVEKR